MLESLSIVWFLLGAISLYFLLIYKSRNARLMDEFPQPKETKFPILGAAHFFIKSKKSDIIPTLCSWCEKLGGAVRIDTPFNSVIFLMEGKYTEKLLSSQVNITKSMDYDYMRPWLGDGLLVSTGPKWAHRRRMLTPAFHFKILSDFLQVFNLEAQKMALIINKQCQPEVTLDISDYITRCALDIICETAMGRTVNAQDIPKNEYSQAIEEYGKLAQDRSFRPWLRIESLFKLSSIYAKQTKVLEILHGFSEKVIRERKAEFLQQSTSNTFNDNADENIYFKSKKRLAFLDLLLEVQREKGDGELSDLDIREETDTFMFEGHDTTSSSASFTIYALGCYPEIQKKVHDELDEIFGDDKTRDVTIEDMTKMKYLELVVKESLRVFPSVPFIQRKLTTDLPLGDGRIIPEGSHVCIFLYQIHRDSKAFPQPNEFRPERFENSAHNPYVYTPFSAGPRNCIGQKFAMMEEKVLISTIFRHFQVKSLIKPENLKLIMPMVLKSEEGLPIQITPR